MSERSFDDFDGFAADYRKIHTENIKLSGADSAYFAEMKVRLLQPFEKNQPLALLDIGCGDGLTELYLQRYFPDWTLQGIDISTRSIEAAQSRNLPKVSFDCFNGTSIAGEDRSVDIVFIAGVLHHVAFSLHDTLLTEIFRLLKPGGRLYLFEHNPLNPFTKYLVKTCVFDKNAKLLPVGYCRKLLQRNGMTEVHKRFIIFFPRKGLLSKAIFLEKYLSWLPLGGQYFFRSVKNS